MKLLPLNIHRPVTDDIPHFAVVDSTALAACLRYRWVTDSNGRPLRSRYSREVLRSRPQSLARFVWETLKQTPPPSIVAHVNHDLLDCRETNLRGVDYPALARSHRTGYSVQEAFAALGFRDVAAARTALGISLEGVPARRGRACAVTPDQVREILAARAGVASTLTLSQFNAEVVNEIVGAPINNLLLSKIIRGKSGRLSDYDYSTVPVFRKR